MSYSGNRVFRGKKRAGSLRQNVGRQIRQARKENHFYFWSSFLVSIVAGSIYLQKFTSVKWEKYDEKYQQLGEEEMLNLIENKRTVDKKNDYYRLQGLLNDHTNQVADDYEIVRVQRRKEDEPVWDRQ